MKRIVLLIALSILLAVPVAHAKGRTGGLGQLGPFTADAPCLCGGNLTMTLTPTETVSVSGGSATVTLSVSASGTDGCGVSYSGSSSMTTTNAVGAETEMLLQTGVREGGSGGTLKFIRFNTNFDTTVNADGTFTSPNVDFVTVPDSDGDGLVAIVPLC